MVMALPFWIAMATECSTSVAASSRDQRDRCSEAAPLIRSSRARASGAESSAGLDHEGQELSVVAAGDGCILPTFPAFHGLGSGGRVCWMLTAAGGQRVHHRHVRQHVPARVYDLQIWPKVAARLQTFHLAHRLPSRQQHCAVQSVLDGGERMRGGEST